MLKLNEIKELMDKMQETNLGEFKLVEGEFELKIKAKKPQQIINNMQSQNTVQAEVIPQNTQPVVENAQAPAPVVEKEINGNVMKSPIVGTFYAAAAPDKPPFASVGAKVKKGDVLFVIESMKLMNEIQSDFDGEVVKIMVENAQGVEYNQPIMIIE